MAKYRQKDRAVSHVLGFILLFGILMVLFSMWQLQVVPQQNAAAEYDHQQEIRDDLLDLRGAIVSAPGDSSDRTVDVDLGLEYPDRTFFRNPPPSSGHLRTVDELEGEPTEIRIENATASDGARPGVDQYWNGDSRAFNTSLLEYTPTYYERSDEPTFVYEHSVLYSDHGDERLEHADQVFIDGNEITLVALDGSLDEQGIEPASVAVEPDAADVRSVPLEAEGDDELVLELPTKRPVEEAEDEWEEVLESEIDGGYVEGVTADEANRTVEIEFDSSQSYDLQLASTTLSNPSATASSEVAYLTVDPEEQVIAEGEKAEFVLEARNAFDNPVSREDIEVSIDNGDGDGEFVDSDDDEITVTTDENGQAQLEFEGDEPGEVGLEAKHAENEISIDFRVTVVGIDDDEEEETDDGVFGIEWNESEPVPIEIEEEKDLEAELADPIDGVGVDFAVENTSILDIEDDPEETTDGTATVTVDRTRSGDAYVYVWTNDGGDRLRVTEPAQLEVASIDSPRAVDAGDEISVTAEIENTDEVEGTELVEFEVDADQTGEFDTEDTKEVPVSGGETKDVSFSYETDISDQPGVDVRVSTDSDQDGETVNVENPAADVEIIDTNSPIKAGDTLVVTAEIDTAPLGQDVRLETDSEVADDTTFDLFDGGEVELEWETDTDDEGEHTVEVIFDGLIGESYDDETVTVLSEDVALVDSQESYKNLDPDEDEDVIIAPDTAIQDEDIDIETDDGGGLILGENASLEATGDVDLETDDGGSVEIRDGASIDAEEGLSVETDDGGGFEIGEGVSIDSGDTIDLETDDGGDLEVGPDTTLSSDEDVNLIADDGGDIVLRDEVRIEAAEEITLDSDEGEIIEEDGVELVADTVERD